jgi:SAM-dependent methyltransferase
VETVGATSALPAAWLADLLERSSLDEGATFSVRGQAFVVRNGIARSRLVLSPAQAQTRETFAFKWKRRETFESAASLARMRDWLLQRYGDVAHAPWLAEHGTRPLLIDAGCGAGMSALELLGPVLPSLRYLGVDASDAVDTARARFAERRVSGEFMQADMTTLPFEEGSVDLILAEGALHHAPSTEGALNSLARLLKPGGRLLFYVYRRKGPVREFTDDYVRARLQTMTPDQAWNAMEPLTRLGVALGELEVEIDIPEAIDLLGIPAGRVNVQRLFYWHVAKTFYHPDLTFDEMNHVNFDWYAPAHAHRQSPQEVRRWCADAGLTIEREVVEDAGITVIARKGR